MTQHEDARWADASLAAALFALDPAGFGGVLVRARPGPVLDIWLGALRALLPEAAPVRRLPLAISEDRLSGGLDLAATLHAGQAVATRGLLAECDGGVLILPMAERTPPGLAARLGYVLDTGETVAERDGLSLRARARIGLVAIDEGLEDERIPASLADRLAFHIDLEGLRAAGCEPLPLTRDDIASARARLARMQPEGGELAESLCATALALGVLSLRAPYLALRAARAAAALAQASEPSGEDAAAAARLVLAPRATQAPALPDEQEDATDPAEDAADPPADEQPQDPSEKDESEREEQENADPSGLDDLLIAAALAAIPPKLLAALANPAPPRKGAAPGRSGVQSAGRQRGRQIGNRKGMPSASLRLDVIATLRAAAPWQPVRRRDTGLSGRLDIRRDDFRVKRLKQRTSTVAVFAVDASGSSALNRLAEAKGAVELLLADCYVRRDEVALIAFRGAGAEVLLPPTRSLARAKRSLAGLPGGGGTPLAAGLQSALLLAAAMRRKGQTPIIVTLTDGRANIALSGMAGRAAAQADSHAVARAIRAAGLQALVIDTSPRPDPLAEKLAAEMAARYLPMPYANAAAVSAAVQVTAQSRARA